MRESIVCTGQVSKNPYRFSETGVMVFSYEELCYYLSRHMICYLYTLPDEELLVFIREELHMEKLYRTLSKLVHPDKDQMKYFAALFREGNYFSEEEIRRIRDQYRNLKNAPYPLQCKQLGDLYVRSGRAAMAISYYQEALKRQTLKNQEAGMIYHNLGIARTKLFRFQDAKIDFVKAYQYSGDEESLFYYYCITAFTESIVKANEELSTFDISDILLESFENRYDGFQDDYEYTESAAKCKKIDFMRKNKKLEESNIEYNKIVRRLQKDFRKELNLDEKMVVTNLPIEYSIENDEN